jgi:hypothetical protein
MTVNAFTSSMDKMELQMGRAELDIKKKKNKERPAASAHLEGASVINKDAPILAALVETDQKWAASDPYDVRGIISGVVKKRGGVPKIEIVLYYLGWAEWFMIDLSLNFNISWICTKQDNLSDLVEALHPSIPH